jgi:hypothetical protein
MTLHPNPEYQPIPVKAVIPRSLGTRSQRINPWIPADEPAATKDRTNKLHLVQSELSSLSGNVRGSF